MTGCSDRENDEEGDKDGEILKRTQKKRSKSEKHVSFPPDGQIVSGFSEHKDRGRNVDSCLTLTEVSSAYRRSCDKHQVEPRPHILEQLKWGNCVGSRVRCLDLRGERLDHRSCEALEVILKSLHFDFINLRAAQLEENGASSLLDMILYYESTTHLDMSDSPSIGPSGWRALTHLIKQSVCLSRLDVCNVSMLDYPAQSLSKALLTSQLAVLHLHNAQLSGTPLYSLVSALKSNRALLELDLSDNQLNSYQDAIQLGDLLRYNRTLQTLELSNNAIADAGLEELCDGLKWPTASLRVLLLRNNQITTDGVVHLRNALPVLKTVEVLDLGGNALGNSGIQTLKEPLIRNRSLLHLGLANSHITCEGTVALAEYLVESHQIRRLDVRQNEVRVGGLMAFSLALRINHSLVDLDSDPIPEQDEFLMATQKRLLSEIADLCVANARRAAVAATETTELQPEPTADTSSSSSSTSSSSASFIMAHVGMAASQPSLASSQAAPKRQPSSLHPAGPRITSASLRSTLEPHPALMAERDEGQMCGQWE
ncbi:protein phosphatase 1 regulatory subunit 37 [Lampris incognitus]|uniref:protein phosphatase 1 regulatory subunit 37 n=1 Tax=Lampris incognitus TaxID=2546036 RepID=UPI0024B57BAC|nr:protein phosphatase 1 regulatory subunit 37 [Lampris incognitus]